jgi:hypothetical protein
MAEDGRLIKINMAEVIWLLNVDMADDSKLLKIFMAEVRG